MNWNWRVVIIVGVAVGLLLIGAGQWRKPNPFECGNIRPFAGDGTPSVMYHSCHRDLRHQQNEAQLLRYGGIAVIVLTCVSIPLLRQRERERGEPGTSAE